MARAGGARDLRGAHVELVGARLEAVLGEHERRGAEGVGLDDVAAGREVRLVDEVHDVGPSRDQALVAAFELGAAEVFGAERDALERGAGGAVEHEDAFLERAVESLDAFRALGAAGVDGFPEGVRVDGRYVVEVVGEGRVLQRGAVRSESANWETVRVVLLWLSAETV